MKKIATLSVLTITLAIGFGVFYTDDKTPTPESTKKAVVNNNAEPTPIKSITRTAPIVPKKSPVTTFKETTTPTTNNPSNIEENITELSLPSIDPELETLYYNTLTEEIIIKDAKTNSVTLQIKVPKELLSLNIYAEFNEVLEIPNNISPAPNTRSNQPEESALDIINETPDLLVIDNTEEEFIIIDQLPTQQLK